MMTHVQRCDKCRYVGEMDYIHGHFACPSCKQQIAFGDCCQGIESSTPKVRDTDDRWQGEDIG